MEDRFPYDPARLSERSVEFASLLFAWKPEWEARAMMESIPSGQAFGLLVDVPSPTGDPERGITVWMDDDEPSVRFGGWHTHATVWIHHSGTGTTDENRALIELLQAILSDQFLLTHDVGGDAPGHVGILDLGQEDTLAELWTNPYYVPPAVQILSWSGALDQVVQRDGLPDLRPAAD